MSLLETLVEVQLKDGEINELEPPRADCSIQCGGHCCRAFYLPYSPGAMAEQEPFLLDGEQIIAMVTYLGEFAEGEGPANMRPGFRAAGHYYQCKNLGDDGLCTVYEERPSMCSKYPYGGPCNYVECGGAKPS